MINYSILDWLVILCKMSIAASIIGTGIIIALWFCSWSFALYAMVRRSTRDAKRLKKKSLGSQTEHYPYEYGPFSKKDQ